MSFSGWEHQNQLRELRSDIRGLTAVAQRLVDLWEAQLPATAVRKADDFAVERSERAIRDFERKLGYMGRPFDLKATDGQPTRSP